MKSITRGGEIVRWVQSSMRDTLSRWGLTQFLATRRCWEHELGDGETGRYKKYQELKTPEIKDAFNEVMSY